MRFVVRLLFWSKEKSQLWCYRHVSITRLQIQSSRMPTVRVETNLAPEFFPEGFMPMFIVAVAELLGKDKKVMKYVFDTNKDMTIVSVINSPFIL